MIQASCHCGAVRLHVSRKPTQLTSCNCSICRRYGALWAYYTHRSVRIQSAQGALESYAWGHRSIRFVRCATCGCVTHWEAAKGGSGSRMGVNARMMEPEVIAPIRIRRLDGASSWKYLDD